MADQFDLINKAAAEAVRAALDRVRMPSTVTGTVIELSADETSATVTLDSPFPEEEPSPGAIVAGHSYLVPGDRVHMLSLPPKLLIIGKSGGGYEDWRQIGVDQNPAFIGSWGPAPDTGVLGDNTTFALPAVKREARRVELRGRLQRATGSLNPSSQTILEEGYRPRNRMVFVTAFGPIAVPSFVIVNPDGLVQALFTGAADGNPPDGFVSWDGISFLVD